MGFSFDLRFRKRKGSERRLKLALLEMVGVQMHVTACPDKFAKLEIALLCHDFRQQSIAGDVEWHSQKIICTSLVQLTGKLPLSNIKLKKCMAWWQGHVINFGRVPCRYNVSSRVRFGFDLMDHVGDLVDFFFVRCGPTSPLTSINRPKVSV